MTFTAEELKRPRLAVTLTFITNGIVGGSLVSRIPDYKSQLHISNSTLGSSLFFASLGVLVALGPAGRLAAKYGSRRISFFSSIALAAIFPLTGHVANLTWLRFTLFLFGICGAIQDVSMNTHAVTLEQKSGRRLMSTFHGMFSLGGFAGGILGGALYQAKVSIQFQTILLSLFILAVALSMKEFWLPASADIHERNRGSKDRAPKRRRPTLFIILGLIGLAEQIGEGASGDWGGVLSKNTFHASPFLATLPYIFFSAAMVIGRFNGDRIAHSIGNQKTLLIGGLLAGTGLTAGLLIGHIYGVVIAWTIVGLGVSVTIPILFSAVGSLATHKYPGVIAPSEGVAMVSGLAYFGFVVGPPMLGFVADHISLRWAMLIPAGLYFLFAAGSFTTKE